MILSFKNFVMRFRLLSFRKNDVYEFKKFRNK